MLLRRCPSAITLRYGPRFLDEAGVIEDRASLERRAEEVLEQEKLAPRRWAARLAPEDLPSSRASRSARSTSPAAGSWPATSTTCSRPAPGRLAAVIGDVCGHGIDASITAFQVKYLLRVFLRQYRDPAQALEELNGQLAGHDRVEEFVSLCVERVRPDGRHAALRVGRPSRGVAVARRRGAALRATGPLLTLDPDAPYCSREIPLDAGDLLLLYTDGLSEARAASSCSARSASPQTCAATPACDADMLCKTLLEAARDFSDTALTDDVAILAMRRT